METFGSPPSESFTQNTDTRKRKRIINWVSLSMNMENTISRGEELESQHVRSGPSTPKHARPSTSSSVEYDSWEAGLSMDELMQLQRELVGSDNLVPDTDMEEMVGVGETDLSSDLEDNGDLLQALELSETSSNRQRQQRSQTVPSAFPQRHQERPTPLRRHQTTSARIDALQRAYSVVANDASQIPVEDLVHATGLANRIQSALNDQLTRRLAGPGGHKPK
ncbi:hypothetical protein DXG03_007446 [Asterophora parasitica]|uniref:Uncharacterized protein n=1 Tax=Asterophora parasitica TaxID=117018 RepID=A0A9P7KD58_9AGAR|nr:hypothetical protein DXG03_007446 [Asterophora parasitica]